MKITISYLQMILKLKLKALLLILNEQQLKLFLSGLNSRRRPDLRVVQLIKDNLKPFKKKKNVEISIHFHVTTVNLKLLKKD